VLPVVFVEGSLDGDSAGDRLARRAEGYHESIPKKDDLTSPVLLELLPEQPFVPAQDFLGEVVAVACAEVCGTLDVCEENGEGSLKLLAHMAPFRLRGLRARLKQQWGIGSLRRSAPSRLET